MLIFHCLMKIKQTLKSMREFLINSQDDEIANRYGLRSGVGLAAPQIDISKENDCCLFT